MRSSSENVRPSLLRRAKAIKAGPTGSMFRITPLLMAEMARKFGLDSSVGLNPTGAGMVSVAAIVSEDGCSKSRTRKEAVGKADEEFSKVPCYFDGQNFVDASTRPQYSA